MADFPKLKTGAVAQYPAAVTLRFPTRVMRFVDGAEQRWARYKTPLRRWAIELSMLDEAELASITAFFANHKGRFGSFSFEDPWTQTVYADCSFEQDDLTLDISAELNTGAKLAIRQNRS